MLVQNQIAGLRYRLTICRLDVEGGLVEIGRFDFEEPTDELEGFVLLGGGRFLMFSAMRERNVHLGSIRLSPADWPPGE